MIQATLYKWSIGLLVLLFSIGGYTTYVYHQGVLKERNNTIATQAAEIKEVKEKVDNISTQYEQTRRKRTVIAQKAKQTEGEMIDDKTDYYSADVLDDDSLQHIQNIQRGSIQGNTP